jgi:putative ribosome biogenesis GTPase RsgA
VREALEGGAIGADRYESYLALLQELEEQPEEWE